MRNLRKALFLAAVSALSLTSPLFAQSSGSAATPASPVASQPAFSPKSMALLQDLRKALDLVEKSSAEIASLKTQLTTARISSAASTEKIAALEKRLAEAENSRLESQKTIDRLEKLLTEAGITVEQQRNTIEKLQKSLDGALIESKTAKGTIDALNESIARDVAKTKRLEFQNGLLKGGVVVALVGGVVAGYLAANALSR